jgi:hypothetical protein
LQANAKYIRAPDAVSGLQKLNSVVQMTGLHAIIEVVGMPGPSCPSYLLLIEMRHAVLPYA